MNRVVWSPPCSLVTHEPEIYTSSLTLNLYFCSQIGPVCLKGVEAYIVNNMGADLLVGEDTQCTWQLHTIQKDSSSYWQVGDSLHRIPTILTPAPTEMFTAQWVPECDLSHQG
jgi:hypothetical protein